jgi:hypothetical protein
MNRFALAILTLAIALGGPASAQTFYRVAPDFQNPHVVGGEVSADGKIILGTGFTARRIAAGEYRVVFVNGLFPDGCPVMTVTDASDTESPATPEVYHQYSACSLVFYVIFFIPGSYGAFDQSFQFVAVGTSR